MSEPVFVTGKGDQVSGRPGGIMNQVDANSWLDPTPLFPPWIA
jgi:hypothetical protein